MVMISRQLQSFKYLRPIERRFAVQNPLLGIIIGDLVPLRQRGYYLAIVFCLNVPIGRVALVVLFLYLHVSHDKEMKLSQKMKRVDYVGNGLLMAGIISMLYALTYAGAGSSWGTWTTLVPFCPGLFSLLLFALRESYGKTPELEMPPRLFRHRTSNIIFTNTFFRWMLAY
ncbi:hypothetical protein CC78DRAFT_584647 [Lojkania enalia]|uniref:Uncharacterized protein n=1 Tax=Lojkania enalia TaxID=147567 RepID=A0A9P4K3A4_9PLEO|nr:hypothetical protein CC78DRAFT_584647 [Didymosphaeria enalia]